MRLCTKCWNRGVIKIRQPIPRRELSDMEIAELLVEGGYFYREIEIPCKCMREKTSSS